MPEMEILSQHVKRIRKDMGMTQATFAPQVGICEEELSLIERGKAKDVKLNTMQKIAAFTGWTVSELLRVETENERATKSASTGGGT